MHGSGCDWQCHKHEEGEMLMELREHIVWSPCAALLGFHWGQCKVLKSKKGDSDREDNKLYLSFCSTHWNDEEINRQSWVTEAWPQLICHSLCGPRSPL